MFTLYELKQNSCFRSCYKTPYYFKNLLLVLIMTLVLGVTYVVYFRADGGNVQNILKILAGLNSNTFNYLTSHQESLRIGRDIRKWNMTGGEQLSHWPTTIEFFSDCVRIGRPCHFVGMAKYWPASQKWKTANGGADYLKNKFGDSPLDTFIGSANNEAIYANRKYSFRNDYHQEMTYSDFLSAHEKKPLETSMKLIGSAFSKILEEDIVKPTFFNVSKLDHVEFFQGSHFIDKPHY